jgi:hypothetical protein
VITGDGEADAEPATSLDLAADEPAHSQQFAKVGTLATATPYDPSRIQEWVRTGVALAVVGAVIVETLILTAAFVSGGIAASDLTAATAAIVTPLVGIAGTVLGFYFGSHRGNS